MIVPRYASPFVAACLAFAAVIQPAASQSLTQSPVFRSGQIFYYQIDFDASKDAKTESNVTTPRLPGTSRLTSSGIIQAEVVSVTQSLVEWRTYFSDRVQPGQPSASVPDKVVKLTLTMDGTAANVSGLNELSAAQQMAWSAWLSKFAASLTFPKPSVRLNQKWQSTETEPAPAPIDQLFWARKSRYVRDEPCKAASSSDAPNKPNAASSSELCAVVFVQASLRQKSPPGDTTPKDYRLRGLKTSGAATGRNETILYVSKSTGIVVRSTESAEQSMDVIVSLADGSNQVHYNLKAKSRSGIRLLPESPR